MIITIERQSQFLKGQTCGFAFPCINTAINVTQKQNKGKVQRDSYSRDGYFIPQPFFSHFTRLQVTFIVIFNLQGFKNSCILVLCATSI